MYTYVSSVALSKSIGAQWETIDLGDIYMFSIFSAYRKVYLTLSNPALPNNVYVDIDVFKPEYTSYTGTLNELLVEIGDTALPTVPSLPTTQIKYAKYSDGFQVGYIADLTIIGQELPPNFPRADMTDLFVVRPKYKTNMALIHSHCLVTVNGYLHQTDANSQKAFIVDGGRTFKHQRDNQFGILSFLDIGAITKIPITEDMILSLDSQNTLYNGAVIDLQGHNLENKTILMSVGGYLTLPEPQVFWQYSNNSVALNLSQTPYVQRYVESSYYLDLSSLGLDQSYMNPSLINVPQLTSDEVIKKYLMLSQSFVIIVDTPNLFFNRKYLGAARLPGEFISYTKPTYPLMVNYGKMVEYFTTEEDGEWLMTVKDSYYRNFVFNYEDENKLNDVSDQKLPMNVFYHSKGFFLEIYSTIV